MRLPRFRLHIFFTGPYILIGLISILVVSSIAIRSARSNMGLLAQDLAKESLEQLVFRLHDAERGANSLLQVMKHVIAMTPKEQLLNDEWIELLRGILLQRADFSSVFLGFADGALLEVKRLDGGRFLVQRSWQQTARLGQSFELLKNGKRIDRAESVAALDLRQEKWFQDLLLSGKAQFYGWSNKSPETERSMRWAAPALTEDDEIKVVLGFDISLDYLNQVARELFAEKNTYGFVIDQAAGILARSWTAAESQQQPDCIIDCSLKEAKKLFPGLKLDQPASYVVKTPREYLNVAISQSIHFGALQLVAFAVISEQAYTAYFYDLMQDVLLATVAIIIFLTLAGYLASLRVTSPILQLNESLKRVGQGQWDAVVALDRKDEIGELSQSFYQMASRMRELVRNLEGLVEERTADLKELLEKYTQMNSKLEKVNASKDKFFSIIAHDLKSPFNALRGYSGIIQDSFDSLSQEQLRSMINRISLAAEEAHGLLENLLQWALIQNGELRINWEVFDAREVVQEVLDLLKINAKVKKVEFDLQLAEPLWIEADRNMVSTVFRNLIANSIKFTFPEQGKITIWAEQGRFENVLIVEDNGVGIEPENLKRLFTKDSYLSERGTENERGTGLGLGICKEFVSMNQARIEVISEVGKGTKFRTIWHTAQAPEQNSEQLQGAFLRILCVDDSVDNHNLIAIFLKDQPWQLDFASNGLQAIDMLKKTAYDVILMDLNMPGISGIETTRRIREGEAHGESNAHPYIIAFTSSVLQSDIDAAVGAGCDSYLVKPIKKDKLIQAIARTDRR